MKEVKEEIKREIVDTHIHYEATDGTIFNDKEECVKYENSAVGVLMARTETFCVARDDSDGTINPLDDGGENNYRLLLPQGPEDIDTLNQLYIMPRTGVSKQTLFTDEHIGKLILMGYRLYDNSGLEWSWFHELDKIIDTMTAGKYKLTPNQK